MIIEEFGDREIYRQNTRACSGGRSRAARGDRTSSGAPDAAAPRRSSAGCDEHVTVGPGFRQVRPQAFGPLILSSGFRELIDPVLEREGVSLEVHANQLDARPDGWRGDLARRRRSAMPAASRASAAACSNGGPVVFVGDGYSDRCAALAADRVFARDGLARYLEERGVSYEPFQDFVQLGAVLTAPP